MGKRKFFFEFYEDFEFIVWESFDIFYFEYGKSLLIIGFLKDKIFQCIRKDFFFLMFLQSLFLNNLFEMLREGFFLLIGVGRSFLKNIEFVFWLLIVFLKKISNFYILMKQDKI